MSRQIENKRRVVITGIGPVSSNGTGKDEFWNGILSGRCAAEKLPERFTRHHDYKTNWYVPLPELNLDSHNHLRKYSRMLETSSVISLLGTELALIDAGLKQDDSTKENTIPASCGIILGNGISSLKTGFSFYSFHTYKPFLEALPENYPKPRFNRLVIPASMPDSASSWISIMYGIKGMNYTMNASCASGTYAVGEAFQKISDGYADMIIAGGVEALNDESGAILRGFDSLGALTKSENAYPMPFSNRRSGFLFAEGGGCIIILEELEHALKRKAKIYAEIADFRSNSDAYNIVQVEESGEQIRNLLKSIATNCKIDYLNTHGTATELNDRVEAAAIKEVFGLPANQPWVNSSKSIMGHTIGASGAFETAITALSLSTEQLHASIGEDLFEDINLVRENKKVRINTALTSSFGFGGHNAALLLKRI